ncbi:WD40 repeat domain-containing protein [Streptomyces sp. NBC_01408]|uniref:WD40 repeat domain-containing protein n=1 Tax=Streptomyces sp. NBC_01408 TaxID=2903855 RepID=UPI002253C74C|nr:WD40 repeat domain-containing protein [Streptomyces sp. NBC_01408]MCX4694994.1 WD40 repeat domain-containing protein [Streptomyces sp. NBC_01408]
MSDHSGAADPRQAGRMRRRAFLAAGGLGAAAAVAVPVGIWLSSGSTDEGAGSGPKDGKPASDGPAGLELAPTATIEVGATDLFPRITYSPDGKILAVALKTSVTLWDAASRAEITTLAPKDAMFTQDLVFAGGLLALGYLKPPTLENRVASDVGGIAVWDVATRKEVAAVTSPSEGLPLEGMSAVALSPDGRLVAGARNAGDGIGKVPVWDVRSGAHVKDLLVGAGEGTRLSSVRSVAFSPDGKMLAAGYGGGPKGGVILFDTSTWSQIATLPLDNAGALGVIDLAFTPDGKTLVGAFGRIAVWDVASRKLTATLGTEDEHYQMAMSPDGSFIATSRGGPTPNGVITLRALPSLKEITSVPAGPNGATHITFHPDGHTLATSASAPEAYSTVQLWNVKRRAT